MESRTFVSTTQVPQTPKKMESDWAERTIVVSGIPEYVLSKSRIIDKLTIHFLRQKNGGGEVESVIYPADATGNAHVTFEKREVVDSVLRQKEQVLEDKQLPVKYPMKISAYSMDVFTQISVDLDLSIFGKGLELNKLVGELQSNNKNLQFSKLPDGRMHIEGSFSALKELRKDLQRRAGDFLEINPHRSVSKSGISASVRKLVEPASNGATQMTHKLAASPNYGATNALHPGVFEEDATVILDADIFTYINECCKKQYGEIFQKNDVRPNVTHCDGITILQLAKLSERCKPFQLMSAKLAIEKLISQMQQSLVTEKIRLDGGRGQKKTLAICKETMQRFPEVWVRITDECVILVGSVDQCNLFRKEVEEKVKTVQSVLDPTFSGHSGSPNATGYSYDSSQGLGSNPAGRWGGPNTSEYLNRNTHSDQYMKSQIDSFQTSQSRNDPYGKCGSALGGPTSLSALLNMGSGKIQDRQSENAARFERSPSNRH
uniref:RNA-binding protein 43-like isoform X1 n=2 Tax=Pristiophorus japonicus TaxID=55135 RepID=UPI00398EE5D7